MTNGIAAISEAMFDDRHFENLACGSQFHPSWHLERTEKLRTFAYDLYFMGLSGPSFTIAFITGSRSMKSLIGDDSVANQKSADKKKSYQSTVKIALWRGILVPFLK